MTVPSLTRDPKTRPANNLTGSTIAKLLAVKAVSASAPDSVALTAASTDVCVGILCQAIPDQGRDDMFVTGRIPCTANGAITAGVRVAAAAAGKIQAAVGGDYVIGTAVDAALADGDVIAVELQIPGATW